MLAKENPDFGELHKNFHKTWNISSVSIADDGLLYQHLLSNWRISTLSAGDKLYLPEINKDSLLLQSGRLIHAPIEEIPDFSSESSIIEGIPDLI